jgi:hypothetical protein
MKGEVVDRRRIRLDELLRATLPGFTAKAGCQGTWRCSSRSAIWNLHPLGPGFWLLLEGHDFPARPALSPLRSGLSGWPWPMKAVRHVPGGTVSWRAELYLQGTPKDRCRLERMVEQVQRLAGQGAGQQTEREGADSGPAEDWQQRVEEVLGRKLEPTANTHCRVPNPEGPAVELLATDSALQARCRLLQCEDELPGVTLAVLEDLLTVANGKLLGCRALFEDTEVGTEAWLECRIGWDDLSAEPVRGAVAALLADAMSLARAGRALAEMPEIGKAYRQYLLRPQERDVLQTR